MGLGSAKERKTMAKKKKRRIKSVRGTNALSRSSLWPWNWFRDTDIHTDKETGHTFIVEEWGDEHDEPVWVDDPDDVKDTR